MVSHADRFVGIVVDKLLQLTEMVENTLSKPVDNIKLLTGSTILGNGNVCLVMDVAAISELLFSSLQKSEKLEATV